jgi:hypothetical protein
MPAGSNEPATNGMSDLVTLVRHTQAAHLHLPQEKHASRFFKLVYYKFRRLCNTLLAGDAGTV